MITYYVGASTDGFIATEDDSLDFLDTVEPPDGEDYGYDAFYQTVDICVWGRKTYDWVIERAEFPYPEKENWILSHSLNGIGEHGERFAVFDAHHWRKLAETNHIWMVGGGNVASIFLQHNIIDQLILTVIPTRLGSGKHFFARGFDASQWTLNGVQHWTNGVIQQTYSFVRAS